MLLLCHLGAWGHWRDDGVLLGLSLEPPLFDAIYSEDTQLTNEHKRALHVGMRKQVPIRLRVVLGILDENVGSAENEHANHDGVGEEQLVFLLLSVHLHLF